jgi:electron transport complex protein RnfC
MPKTFNGGVHPAALKEFTVDKHIRSLPVPTKVTIPLLQHTGAPCRPLVSTGDAVSTGQVIGVSDSFISSPVHSSISGKVTGIEMRPHPVAGRFDAVTIEGDGIDPSSAPRKKREPHLLSADQMREIIKDAGIVGMGGAAFPAHVKLTPPPSKKIDSFILNGAECEPYLTCDHRLMLEKTREIVGGLGIIKRITGVPDIYIGVESNKIGAAFALEKALRDRKREIGEARIVILKTKYPQGAEKQLIKAILNREVPPGKLPFDVGCVVSNVGTVFAIYEAVLYGKPLYERVVTIAGSCLKDPSNLMVRVGVPARDLVEACGGFKEEPAKVIFGGPMMGLTQFTLDVPVIKGTSGILFMSKEEVKETGEKNCIRCARCVDVCPVNLVPTDIARLVKSSRHSDAAGYNIEDCIECGACSFECPSKIPLLQWIRIGKSELTRSRKGT